MQRLRGVMCLVGLRNSEEASVAAAKEARGRVVRRIRVVVK